LLRSIVRQDPDVIMVGEIRDLETAQIAIQSALTGHLVLSTLHTNSAAATVTRLRDMGVEDFLLTATLRAVVAQRLVRRLCRTCKVPEPASAAQRERFGLSKLSPARSITLHRAAGCPECRHTGYQGRRAIGEVLVPNPRIEKLICEGADANTIERAAIADGMRPIFDSGMLAVLEGETTIEEVARSVHTDA
jgi:general secretion pathway protein E